MAYQNILVYTTAVSLYLLMVVGAYLTVNPGYGLLCPDWPLCQGQLIPPLAGPVLVEYAHRLLTVLSTILLFASLAGVWRMSKKHRNSLRALALGSFLLVVQILLGAAAVFSALDPLVTTSHLAVAILIFGSVIAAAVTLRSD